MHCIEHNISIRASEEKILISMIVEYKTVQNRRLFHGLVRIYMTHYISDCWKIVVLP